MPLHRAGRPPAIGTTPSDPTVRGRSRRTVRRTGGEDRSVRPDRARDVRPTSRPLGERPEGFRLVLVRRVGAEALAGCEGDRPAVELPCRRACGDEMGLHAEGIAQDARLMGEHIVIDLRPEFAPQPLQHVEVERRHQPVATVIRSQQGFRVLRRVRADEKPARPKGLPRTRQQGFGLVRQTVADSGIGKEAEDRALNVPFPSSQPAEAGRQRRGAANVACASPIRRSGCVPRSYQA